MHALIRFSAIGARLVCGFFFLLATMVSSVLGQDFPYLVPEAPEFDARGNLMRSAPTPRMQEPGSQTGLLGQSPSSAPSFANPPKTQLPDENQRYRSERREAPRTSYQDARSHGATPAAVSPVPRPGQPRAYEPNPNQMPNQQNALGAPGPGQAVNPPRPDCSEYPARLAHARTEAEMQAVARYYLGCLMQNGWNQATATTHVSTLIDTWYRYSR